MLFQISKDHKIYLLLYSVKIFHHSEIFEYTDALNLPNLRVDFCIVYPSHEIDFTMPGDIRRPFHIFFKKKFFAVKVFRKRL